MGMIHPQEALAAFCVRAIREGVSHGMVQPITLVVVSRDGFVAAQRFGDQMEVVREFEEGLWHFPINMLLVDANGRGARVVIDEDQAEPEFVN